MKIRYLFTIVVMLLICFGGSGAFAQDVPELAEKALAATVYLEMTDTLGQPISYGSGFFVSFTHIVTNFHVVAGTAKGTAKLVDKTETYPIEGIIAIDPENDLVLLKVTVTTFKLRQLWLGDSDKVRIGERVYVAGNPKGLEGTFSDGIISRISKQANKNRIQMTAPISPGSSGGPVLNTEGKVIGVAFMTIKGGQNLNFAIPSKYVKVMISTAMRETKLRTTPLAQSKKSMSAETYYNRGNTKYKLGLYKEAILDYDTAIRLKPDYAEAQHNRGVAKVVLGQHFSAILDFDTAILFEPDFAVAYYIRGVATAALGQYKAAILDYDTAIRLKPDHTEAYHTRGVAKAVIGQHFAAISDYDIAIRLKPDYAEAYAFRGSAKAVIGQHFAAISDYDIAIRLKPDYAEAYAFRGGAKAVIGQHFAAISDYDIAIRLKPDYAGAFFGRGVSKAQLNQYKSAILDFDSAIRLKPDFPNAYYHRGLSKGLLRRFLEAKQDLQTALKLATQAGNVNFKKKIEKALRLLK